MRKLLILLLLIISTTFSAIAEEHPTKKKKLVYLVSDINIPFWKIMSRGIEKNANELGYETAIYSANNTPKEELINTVKAINEQVDGIIISPINSSTCVTVLKLAKKAKIPVVIADVGADSKEYISYISSNNFDGAYGIGKILATHMIDKGWQDGRVGIIAIPQTRLNGQQRTAGFLKALEESNIKGATIKQIKSWSDEENYTFVNELIDEFPDLRAIWYQTSNSYKGVLKALEEREKKEEIAFIAFDAEPEFLELIKKGDILGSGMQQPYLIGKESVKALHQHINKEPVAKEIQLPILHVSTQNIKNNVDKIRLNVLGIE